MAGFPFHMMSINEEMYLLISDLTQRRGLQYAMDREYYVPAVMVIPRVNAMPADGRVTIAFFDPTNGGIIIQAFLPVFPPGEVINVSSGSSGSSDTYFSSSDDGPDSP